MSQSCMEIVRLESQVKSLTLQSTSAGARSPRVVETNRTVSMFSVIVCSHIGGAHCIQIEVSSQTVKILVKIDSIILCAGLFALASSTSLITSLFEFLS